MFVIRKATREDVPAILGLVRQLAAYEREPDAVVATEEDFIRDGFGEAPAFEVLVTEDPGSPTGGTQESAASPREGTRDEGGTQERAQQAGGPSGAAAGKRLIAFAFYFFSYSTWVGRRCLYLEDLFVEPSSRGRGAGIALMQALARVAAEKDCRRIAWQVLAWNSPAIAFYEKLGATVMREWLTVRLEGEALARLAALPAANTPRSMLRAPPTR